MGGPGSGGTPKVYPSEMVEHVERLYRYNKPECGQCGTTDPARSYNWANLSGDYKDPTDYELMCRSCHWRFDNKVANRRKGGGATC